MTIQVVPSCAVFYYAVQIWPFSIMTIQIKSAEHYFPLVLFVTLYDVVSTFECAIEILHCDHGNESCWAVRLIYCAVQGDLNMWFCGGNPKRVTIQVAEQYFLVMLLITVYKVSLTVESADEILKYDRSNESYRGVFSCGTVYPFKTCT